MVEVTSPEIPVELNAELRGPDVPHWPSRKPEACLITGFGLGVTVRVEQFGMMIGFVATVTDGNVWVKSTTAATADPRTETSNRASAGLNGTWRGKRITGDVSGWSIRSLTYPCGAIHG